MENLELLIDQTQSYAVEQPDLYEDDYRDFVYIRALIVGGKLKHCVEYINDMDTLPREQVLSALEKDGYI
jgi:hypothetical protein